MSQTPYKFVILSGMAGFMPNYNSGPLQANTRKELAEILREQLDMLDYPANRFNDFCVADIWRRVQAFKSGSSVHSNCEPHQGETMFIQGLTDEEYTQQLNEDY